MVAVSIIIPTYNRAQFIGAAIDSALGQGEDVEVAVVDDGSTDATDRVLQRYGDRISLLRQPNLGPSAARNHGAEQSRADFLFFLDSDDMLEPGAIAGLREEYERRGGSKLPFGRASTIDATGRGGEGPAYGFPDFEPGHELKLAELVGQVMPLWLYLIPRKQFLALGGLSRDLRLGEDHEFALRMHRSGQRYVVTDVPVLKIRQHEGDRLSDTRTGNFGVSALVVWSRIAAIAREAADWNHAAAIALGKAVWIAGRDAARGSDRAAADRLFQLARSLDASVARVNPIALRLVGKVIGYYRAERLFVRLKSLVGRS